MYKHLEDTFENEYGRWRVHVWFDKPYRDKRIVERIVRVEGAEPTEAQRGHRPIAHVKSVTLHKRKFLRGVVRDPDAPDLAEHIEQAVEETMEKNERLLERDARGLEDVGVDL